jgi:hypothetical protein
MPSKEISRSGIQTPKENNQLNYLPFCGYPDGVIGGDSGGVSGNGATAILLQQVQRAVGQVAQPIGQPSINQVPEPLLRKVSILESSIFSGAAPLALL